MNANSTGNEVARALGRVRASCGLSLLLLAACGGGSDNGATGQAPCGAPPGDWKYLFSCDQTFAGLVHECIDYYATAAAASAVETSFRAVCQVGSGSASNTLCPSAGSVGSCVDTASSGPTGSSPQAALSRTYIYQESSTPQGYQAECERLNGVYAPPAATGTSPMTNASGGGACAQSSSSGAQLFSVETVANGEIIECTNYAGAVSQAELDSVLRLGALAAPCPAANAICSCAGSPGSGTFGTDPELVYYKTTISGSDSSCPNTDPACVSSYTPP
jgi:hypothetical protein